MTITTTTTDHGPGGERSRVDVFLEEISEDLTQGVLPARAFSDPELHRLELERIFTTSWVFVGHESEVSSPGDYVLRYIGNDQFILSRDEDGELNLLFNACMHRGTPVCHADKGNASHFRCAYHGWIYRNNGDWNGAPHRGQAYGKTMDAKKWGLRKAAKIDSYQGLIFANLDPDSISLDEYLGDMKWYLDITLGLAEGGMKVVGDPHRWEVDANWKSGAENFAGDAYHVPHLHRSGEETGIFPGIDNALDTQFHVTLPNGHGLVATTGFLPPPMWKFGAWPDEVVETFDLDRLEPEQREFIESGKGVTVMTIFPNLSIIRAPGVYNPEGTPPVVFTAIRLWQPLAPDKTTIWNWPLVWPKASEEFQKLQYLTGIAGFGPAGLFEQDDTVAWVGPAKLGESPVAQSLKFNYMLGEGVENGAGINPDWTAPGIASTTAYDEYNQRNFWSHWVKKVGGND